MPTWEDVVTTGLQFPGVEETKWYGTPALKVEGKGMCRLRTKPDALVLRVIDLSDREALLRGRPEAYFTTPHYDATRTSWCAWRPPIPAELAELVEDAWRIQAPRKLVVAYDRQASWRCFFFAGRASRSRSPWRGCRGPRPIARPWRPVA